MNEDFVSFDLAKKLKERGFRYNKNNLLDRLCMENQINHPSISQVLKWLRKEKKIFICIDPRFNVLQDKFVYRFYITNLINQDRDSTFEDYNDWETAVLEGIEYCLDYLI